MSENGFSREQIRAVVREALREAIPEANAQNTPAKNAHECQLMKQIRQSIQANCRSAVIVDIESNEKLNLFLRDFSKCLQDRNVSALIRAGRLKFSLKKARKNVTQNHSGRSVQARTSQVNKNSGDGRLDSGVLTEAKILAFAKNHQRVVIGRRVVLTPLAKDRARRVNLEIVRQ